MREVHVWTAATARLESTGRLAELRRLCSPEERARAARFVFEADRRAFVAAHGLLRLALNWSAPAVDPAGWLFRPGDHGRPDVAGPAAGLGMRFNLSHTREWTACVVTRDVACGIDVESIQRSNDHEALAARTLTPREARELARAEPAARPRRFIELWTLKEALAKALGIGLGLPFHELGFAVRPEGIGLVERAAGVPGRWRFERWAADDAHVVALAVRHDGEPLQVIRHSEPPDRDPGGAPA